MFIGVLLGLIAGVVLSAIAIYIMTKDEKGAKKNGLLQNIIHRIFRFI